MATELGNRGPELVVVNITFLAIAIITSMLRCYVRYFLVKAFRKDDWLMVVSTIFFTLYATFSSVGVTHGTGRHHANLKPEQIHTAMMCWWLCYLWYSLAMISCKLSIGYFLLRVINTKLQMWIIYITMFSTAFSGALFFFITLFQCYPVSFFWNKDQPGTCIKIDIVIALATLYSSLAVISDFVLALLPGFIIWNLQMHRGTKYSLIPLLAMGCVASAAVIARFPYLPLLRKPDFLWNTLDVAIWSTVEQGLAITASSLATLRPLLKVAAFRLNITTPTSPGQTGPRFSMPALRPRPCNSFSGGEAYTLSSVSRPEPAYQRKSGFRSSLLNDLKGGIQREIQWEVKISHNISNESEEELHPPEPWKTNIIQ